MVSRKPRGEAKWSFSPGIDLAPGGNGAPWTSAATAKGATAHVIATASVSPHGIDRRSTRRLTPPSNRSSTKVSTDLPTGEPLAPREPGPDAPGRARAGG